MGKSGVSLACVVDTAHHGVWGKGWIRGGSEEWEQDTMTSKTASTAYCSAYTTAPVLEFHDPLALRFWSPGPIPSPPILHDQPLCPESEPNWCGLGRCSFLTTRTNRPGSDSSTRRTAGHQKGVVVALGPFKAIFQVGRQLL